MGMTIGENSSASMLEAAPMKYRSHMEGGDSTASMRMGMAI